MLFNNMTNNYTNNQSVHQTNDIDTTPINSLYQKFYSINCIKTNNPCSYPPPKNVLTNRDVYNCTDECIHSKQLSGEYDIIRTTNNKTKNIICYECNEYTDSIIPIIFKRY